MRALWTSSTTCNGELGNQDYFFCNKGTTTSLWRTGTILPAELTFRESSERLEPSLATFSHFCLTPPLWTRSFAAKCHCRFANMDPSWSLHLYHFNFIFIFNIFIFNILKNIIEDSQRWKQVGASISGTCRSSLLCQNETSTKCSFYERQDFFYLHQQQQQQGKTKFYL